MQIITKYVITTHLSLFVAAIINYSLFTFSTIIFFLYFHVSTKIMWSTLSESHTKIYSSRQVHEIHRINCTCIIWYECWKHACITSHIQIHFNHQKITKANKFNQIKQGFRAKIKVDVIASSFYMLQTIQHLCQITF